MLWQRFQTTDLVLPLKGGNLVQCLNGTRNSRIGSLAVSGIRRNFHEYPKLDFLSSVPITAKRLQETILEEKASLTFHIEMPFSQMMA